MDAHSLALQFWSPRAKRLDRFERYVDGTQYDGRVPFLSQSEDAPPLLERAPTIVYPIVANAIRSNSDFVLGEGRWPSMRISEDERLDDDERKALEALIAKAVEQARGQAVARELLDSAQGCGTAVAIVGVKLGRLHVETVRAAWCTPTFDDLTGDVTALEISYPYVECVFDAGAGKWRDVCRLYRRVIDTTADVTFEPIEARPGVAPTWVERARVEHGLGFCPVVWYALMASCSHAADIDGTPIHAKLLDEVDALNFTLSQRHRAAIYCGDPQVIEKGVDKHTSHATGRTASVTTEAGSFAMSGPRRAARRKGPGTIWSYETADASVELLTLPGDALKVLDDHARDLKSKIHESLGVVDIDLENAKLAADASGKALEVLHRRQIDRCNQMRTDFGARCLVPLVSMLLRVAFAIERQRAGSVYLSGLTDAMRTLAGCERVVDGVGARWFAPAIELLWGPYFKPTDGEAKGAVEAVQLAIQTGLISRKQGVEKLKPYFPHQSADEVLAAIAATPSLEQALQVQAVNLGSPTFDRLFKERLALSLLGRVDEAEAEAIRAEVGAAIPPADAARDVDQAEAEAPETEDDGDEDERAEA